jgi:hypothetical protein
MADQTEIEVVASFLEHSRLRAEFTAGDIIAALDKHRSAALPEEVRGLVERLRALLKDNRACPTRAEAEAVLQAADALEALSLIAEANAKASFDALAMAKAELVEARRARKVMWGALKFYADERSWQPNAVGLSPVVIDNGTQARIGLSGAALAKAADTAATDRG